jgi:hypothetical protein
MNPVNSGSVHATTDRVHATTGRVLETIGRVHGTIGRMFATVGSMSEKIIAGYHTCLTSYRAEYGILNMSHGWSGHVR